MTKVWVLGLAMVVFGYIIGPIYDRVPERADTRRAGYRVVQGDFHVHTRYSDGFFFPFDVVRQADRSGLDVVAITEHNMTLPAKMGAWYQRIFGGPLVLIGEEVTTHRFHLIAVGLEDTVSWRLSLADAIADIHAQGGVAIAAHPTKRYWDVYGEVIDTLDGAEVVHPVAFRGPRDDSAFRHSEMVEFYDRHQPTHARLAAIGSSDFHFLKALGVCRTLLFVSELSKEGVLDAIRAGRTVAEAPDGRMFGPPELVRALDAEPVASRANPFYDSVNRLDAWGRVCGWLGLVVLCFFSCRFYESSRVQRASNASENDATSDG